jgi:hypothetical protein
VTARELAAGAFGVIECSATDALGVAKTGEPEGAAVWEIKSEDTDGWKVVGAAESNPADELNDFEPCSTGACSLLEVSSVIPIGTDIIAS